MYVTLKQRGLSILDVSSHWTDGYLYTTYLERWLGICIEHVQYDVINGIMHGVITILTSTGGGVYWRFI